MTRLESYPTLLPSHHLRSRWAARNIKQLDAQALLAARPVGGERQRADARLQFEVELVLQRHGGAVEPEAEARRAIDLEAYRPGSRHLDLAAEVAHEFARVLQAMLDLQVRGGVR